MITGAWEQFNPLESFFRDYVSLLGGLLEQIEPQVYDVLLPESSETIAGRDITTARILRIAFDPEAVPEHPGAQLVTFGTPLLDTALNGAQREGRYSRAYLLGLNLQPSDLAKRLTRTLDLPAGAAVTVTQTRGLHFTILVFWFAATYISDHKEQDLFQVAIDLFYGRQVRHLDRLLDRSRLHERPAQFLPDAPQKNLVEAYLLARDRTVRTLSATANVRRRELQDHSRRQEARMIQYYRDLRTEVDEQMARLVSRSEDTSPVRARRQAIEREENLRLAELRKKNALRVELHLMNVLEIRQPKLLVEAEIMTPKGEAAPLELVWDPLTEAAEAPTCPGCGQPTFSLRFHSRQGLWQCQTCAAASSKKP